MTKGVKGFRKGHKHSEQTKQKIAYAEALLKELVDMIEEFKKDECCGKYYTEQNGVKLPSMIHWEEYETCIKLLGKRKTNCALKKAWGKYK